MPSKGNEARSSFPESAVCVLTDEEAANPQPPPKALLTVNQISLLYGIERSTVYTYIKYGKLKAVKKPGQGKTSSWVIVDPGWNHGPFQDKTPWRSKDFLVDNVHILQGQEVALLLGISPRGVRKMVEQGRLQCITAYPHDKSIRRFSVADVRRAMATRLKYCKQEKRPSRSKIRHAVLNWAKGRLGMDKLPEKRISSSHENQP